ncbi:hypothetical protein HCG49_09755 [Arenibacter sp. 6A1]|uniref:O-antigen ligase family protein n=1 Tax=Arenibacter sp. 6A1 TaxID=2720391 RepID=UPI001448989C|nr:O-antigen ligase family protein [Arenibacter sp. 6A1]NKI26847.1 hypothetical protein [Arenibacter sp. 6A1]
MANIKQNHFNLVIISVFLSFSSILLRGEIFVSITLLINIAVLLLYNLNYKNKRENIVFKKELFILTIPFFLSLFGLLWSTNYINGLELVFRSLPLILVPWVYIYSDKDIIRKGFQLLEIYFPIMVLVTYYSNVLIGLYLKSIGYGDYLYYSGFSKIVDVHTTYMALIIICSTLFIIKRRSELSMMAYYGVFFGHVFLLILIASKVAFIIIAILMIYEFFLIKVSTIKKTILFLGILIAFFFTVSKVFETRLANRKLEEREKLATTELFSNFLEKDVQPRYLLWKSSINSLEGLEILFGNGTGSHNDKRLKEYKINGLNKAIKENYNSHNQFVESFYMFGIVGFLIFIYHCCFLLKSIYNDRNWFLFLMYSSVLIFFITESILLRSLGIIIYSYIITYVYMNLEQNFKKEKC